MQQRMRRRLPDEQRVIRHNAALTVTNPEFHDVFPIGPRDTFVKHHAVALGNRTRRSARAAAKLERERGGAVQHI